MGWCDFQDAVLGARSALSPDMYPHLLHTTHTCVHTCSPYTPYTTFTHIQPMCCIATIHHTYTYKHMHPTYAVYHIHMHPTYHRHIHPSCTHMHTCTTYTTHPCTPTQTHMYPIATAYHTHLHTYIPICEHIHSACAVYHVRIDPTHAAPHVPRVGCWHHRQQLYLQYTAPGP